MKKALVRVFETSFFGVLILLTSLSVLAQPVVVEPGDKSVDPTLLNAGKFTWQTNATDGGSLISVQRSTREITIEKRDTKKGLEVDNMTVVLNAKTLDPIRFSYKGEELSANVQYGARIKGSRTTYETNKKENLDEPATGKYFAFDSLPFVISSLPLRLDYRVTLPVMRFDGNFKPQYLRYRITDVSEQKSFSCLSGTHDLWKVTVNEKTRNHMLVLYIDKTTRRLLRTEHSFDGLHLSHNIYILVDKETDVNPIKATFNANETMAMLTGGTSSIKGQASTKISEKRIIGNKTQYAPKGSLVAIIPNTPYFKEWVDFNLAIGKISRPVYFDGKLVEGCSYPLPQEVSKSMRLTEVVDDKGNFVFQNLRPGEYLVFVGFVANKYTHTTRTPTGDYTVTVNADGTGSATQIIDVKHWMSPQNVINHKFVTITKEGEAVSVKLKD